MLQKSQLVTQNTRRSITSLFFFRGLCILDLSLKHDVNSAVHLFLSSVQISLPIPVICVT